MGANRGRSDTGAPDEHDASRPPEVGEEAGGAERLNLKQAASVLGVHYMTAYRYVRQGRLDAERDGTQWRVARGALERFLAPGAAGPAREEPAATTTSWSQRLETCLLAGDETAAWRVIENALASGRDPTFCYLGMVASALASIGDGWACGELDVAGPYLATAVAARLVARLSARFRRPGRSRGTVIFGAPPGEFHSLPIAIVSDLVRLSGYDVLELGANVPADAFVSGARRTPRLVAIGIGVTQPELLDAVQDVVDAIRVADETVPIVVGGLAVSIVEQASMRGATAVAASGREAVAIIERFAATRAMRMAV